MLAFFRRQNGQAFFPPLPIAALLRHSWRGTNINGGAWDISVWRGWFRREEQQACFFAPGWHGADLSNVGWDASTCLGYFHNEKSQHGIKSMLAF